MYQHLNEEREFKWSLMYNFVAFRRMEWSLENDVVLCTEIRVREPYKFKKCSNERGKIWTEIASTLNSNKEVKFHVTQRGVRERYEGLKAKYLEKIKGEEKASGISPEVTELDKLLEEIVEKESLAESSRESDSTIKKNEEERKVAEDLRKTAMESMGETKKRSMESEGGDISVKRKRRSGSDAVEYLRERAEKEIKIREEELALRKQKQDQEASKQSQLFQQQNEMLKAMKEQQIQMQNIQAMMLQQQQQQTAALMSMLGRFIPKQ